MTEAALTLVYLGPAEDNLGDSAIRLDRRTDSLVRLGPAMGLELRLVKAEELPGFGEAEKSASPASLRERFEGSAAVWWFGRSSTLAETTRLHEAAKALLAELGLAIPVYEYPELVEESNSLALSYPKLARAGLPQAATRFYPMSPRECEGDEAAIEAMVRRKLRWSWLRGDHFFRTYYGTLKIHAGLNMAHSKAELIAGATRLIKTLRERQDIGGLAVRELLPIASLWDKTENTPLSREYRIFVSHGTPIWWSCDYQLETLRPKLDEDDLARLGGISEEQRETMIRLAGEAGRALDSRLLCVDFAVLEDGSVSLVEVNPGYCSGWPHDAAFLFLYGRFLRRLAGLPDRSTAEWRAVAVDCELDLWGEGVVWRALEG